MVHQVVWQAYVHRFDLEYTDRFRKQPLNGTTPRPPPGRPDVGPARYDVARSSRRPPDVGTAFRHRTKPAERLRRAGIAVGWIASQHGNIRSAWQIERLPGSCLPGKDGPDCSCSLESRHGFHGSGSRTNATESAENPLPSVASLAWQRSGVRARSGPLPRQGKTRRGCESRHCPVPEPSAGQKAEMGAQRRHRDLRGHHARLRRFSESAGWPTVSWRLTSDSSA
jgi:hypothetical protein